MLFCDGLTYFCLPLEWWLRAGEGAVVGAVAVLMGTGLYCRLTPTLLRCHWRGLR